VTKPPSPGSSVPSSAWTRTMTSGPTETAHSSNMWSDTIPPTSGMGVSARARRGAATNVKASATHERVLEGMATQVCTACTSPPILGKNGRIVALVARVGTSKRRVSAAGAMGGWGGGRR
jgi:hypothetical protein